MKRFAVLAAGLLALLGTTAAQAGAVQGQANAPTAATCVSDFSSLRVLTGRGEKRGHFDEREPELTKGGKKSALDKAKGKKGGKDFGAKIPVYVHVVTAGGQGAVSDEVIEEQIQVLNLSYAGFFGGADSGIRFKLKKVDRTDNAAWHAAGPESAEEAEMKRALKRGKPDELDLYLTSGGGYAGWAFSPDIVQESQHVLDGVVVAWVTLPGGPVPGFDLGHTATHEVGHWFGLLHTFHPGEFPGAPSGCSGEGDGVDDTPAHDLFSDPGTVTGPCGEGSDSCPAAGVDPIHNFMTYSFDQCYREFTAGQAARMQSQFLYWRDKGKYPKA